MKEVENTINLKQVGRLKFEVEADVEEIPTKIVSRIVNEAVRVTHEQYIDSDFKGVMTKIKSRKSEVKLWRAIAYINLAIICFLLFRSI